jgi:acetoin utilization protein AcuB
MMFIAYGPGITNPIALEKLFVKPAVAKVSRTPKSRNITDEDSLHDDSSASTYRSERARKAYQSEESALPSKLSLKASQIMTTPVISLQACARAREAVKTLETSGFRHIPVLSHQNQLVGMVSDRDIYRCMCGSDAVCLHCSSDKEGVLVENVMKDQVLAASADVDARYIARLFAEQRVGAMPIVENDQLVGIVTRSDILKAVMLHFSLDVWE